MFLQSAGTPRKTVQALYEGRSTAALSPRQRALVALAEQLTSAPEHFGRDQLSAIRETLPDDGDFVEAVNVVAGFNFANRVADALDVSTEVPDVLERSVHTKRFAMSVMSWGIRKRMNFTDLDWRTAGDPDEALHELDVALTARGMERPAYFERLAVRPHILRGHVDITCNLLSTVDFPQTLVLGIGYLTASLNGDATAREQFRRALPETSIASCDAIAAGRARDLATATWEEDALSFVRQVTLSPDDVTDEDVLKLREIGLDDVGILNLVLLTAAGNAANRLSAALVGAPAAALTAARG
jgi:alkylhydroperoxidase family enzyme